MEKAIYPNDVRRYRICGDECYAQYMGRQKGFECVICGKGCNAFTFNILHGESMEEAIKNYKNDDYETVGFGQNHLEENAVLLTEVD